jgi:hypothetical protein
MEATNKNRITRSHQRFKTKSRNGATNASPGTLLRERKSVYGKFMAQALGAFIIFCFTPSAHADRLVRVYISYGQKPFAPQAKEARKAAKQLKVKIKLIRYCDSFEDQFPYYYSCPVEKSCLEDLRKRLHRNGLERAKYHFYMTNYPGFVVNGNLGAGNITAGLKELL